MLNCGILRFAMTNYSQQEEHGDLDVPGGVEAHDMNKGPEYGVILPTTVVGSYPVTSGHGLWSLFDPMRAAVKTAVDDQVTAGIDIISDGQVRGDMIQAFTGVVPGIKGQEVTGKVQASASPITVGDVRFARSRKSQVKGIITGPSTLAHGLHISTPMYRDRDELAMDIASAFIGEAKALESLGVTILQLDEPILSTGTADLDVGRKAIELITSSVRIPSCMHVCGNLSGVIDEVIKFPVNILDFEFSNNRKNLELFNARDLGGRMIGYGCVDSTTNTIEPVDEIRKRIDEGIEVFGAEALLIDPDCGMRMRTREAAFTKLSHMVQATREIRESL